MLWYRDYAIDTFVQLEARLVGLALTQSLQLSGLLQWMARQSAEVENHMTSVERMLHYTQLEQVRELV